MELILTVCGAMLIERSNTVDTTRVSAMNKLLAIAAIAICFDCVSYVDTSDTTIPQFHKADGKLRVYVLPVGQGDGHVIQCPNGDLTIVDLGTSTQDDGRYWQKVAIGKFLEPQFDNIRNVVITHDDEDHFKLIPVVLDRRPKNLTNIYISCNSVDLHEIIVKWLDAYLDAVRTFNEGKSCVQHDCGPLYLCPGDKRVNVTVMSANLGQCAGAGKLNKNDNSIVFKVTFGGTSIMFNGDFQKGIDDTSTDEDWFVEYYNTTIFKLAHHGGVKSNPAIRVRDFDDGNPKALFVSGNPYHRSYGHPRCKTIDDFIRAQTNTICQPEDGISCDSHPYRGREQWLHSVQEKYVCGNCQGVKPDPRIRNGYAVYTTQVDEYNINLIEIVVNSTGHWGFNNTFIPTVNCNTATYKRTTNKQRRRKPRQGVAKAKWRKQERSMTEC